MKKSFPKKVILSFFLIAAGTGSYAQQYFFTDMPEASFRNVAQKRVTIPTNFRTVSVDKTALLKFLQTIPAEGSISQKNKKTMLQIPMPKGDTAKFYIWESSAMAPELAAKFPGIKTYTGQGITDGTATIKVDWTEFGFHAMILSPVTGSVFIDPYAQGNTSQYIVYFKKDLKKTDPYLELPPKNVFPNANGSLSTAALAGSCRGTQLYRYRLAVACTHEYAIAATGLNNPTVAQTLAKIVTTVNRVNGVYEKEVSVTMVLVGTENNVVFTNALDDPFSGNDDPYTLIDESQSVIDAKIGNSNYDIGHTFSTGGGGLAYLGVICSATYKARGITGSSNPTGDAYDIDYVAHEVGHQFGGSHTFNSVTGNCSGNRNSSTAYEPGSATTIMGYAGICGSDDIQPNSDPFFHSVSFDEISTYLQSGGGCATVISTGNTPPQITAMNNNGANIPLNTPFTLTASATDADVDALTYSWEEWDLGNSGAWNSGATSISAPLFKARVPKTTGSRTFPDMAVILAGYPSVPVSAIGGLKGETLPAVARAIKFRLTVRDNHSGGGGVVTGGDGCAPGFTNTFKINTVSGTGPFIVTAPNGGESWGANTLQTITWNIAGTSTAPISCSAVIIQLSTDGGLTYPDTLLANTPNDGSQQVTLPAIATNTARIRVKAVDNIFFDISNNNFSIANLSATFANNGVVKTDMGAPYEQANVAKQVLLQAGSVYVVFESGNTTSITKKFPDGSTDSSYGNNGLSASVAISASHAALQKDGKIVVAGFTPYRYGNYDYKDFAVARFNVDGSLDNTFDGDGILTNNFGLYNNDFATCVAVQSDGKIVVSGVSVDDYDEISYLALARYNTDGSLDNAFNGNGTLIEESEGSDNSIATQADGKIILAGDFLARYNTDGSPDVSFGVDGKQDAVYGVSSVAIQSNGKIVTAGSNLTRCTADGKLDSTFAGDGIQDIDFSISSLVIQDDQKIVVAGTIKAGSNNNFAVARYTVNGLPDNSFDADGRKLTDFGAADDYINSIAPQTDGKLIAVGYTASSAHTYIAATRYTINGSLDNSFDGDGKLTDHLNQGNTFFSSTAIQSNGKIVAAGNTGNGINQDFAVVRYNTDGSLDNTFAGGGKRITNFGSSSDYANSVAIQNDGKIIVGGSAGNNFGLARYDTAGNPDNSFSGDGLQVTGFGATDYISKIVIQNDGKILAGGSVLARYNADGSLDAGFGAGGYIALSYDGQSFNCKSIALQSDGKIVISGGSYFLIVARYNTNGSIDNTFGDNGADLIYPGEDEALVGSSIAIQNDGKIVIGGYTEYSYRTIYAQFALIRLNTDGSFDNSFGYGGMSTTPIGNNYSVAYGTSVAILANQKIVLAGYSFNGSSDDFTVIRYNDDGNVDNSFGDDGIKITPASGAHDRIAGIATAGNKLYAVGYGQYPGNFGVIVRYLLEENKAPFVNITAPANNATYTIPAAIILKANATDPDGTIAYVQFYNGATLLKTDSTSPYSYTTNILKTGNYSFVAKATDNSGLSSNSATVAVSIINPVNKAPFVNITTPVNNSSYIAPAAITINATASDPDGTITSVKFYNGSILLKTDSTSPYSYTLSNAVAGSYKFYAKAIDNNGLENSSATVSAFVMPGAVNKAPVVNLTAPVNNATYTAPATIVLNATASVADGTIRFVQFYNGGALVKTDSISPYSFTINTLGQGKFSFAAKATDNKGSVSNSATVAVFISTTPGKAPVVNITGPANNTTYIAPAAITINATASDPDGTVTSVKFYNGSTLLKTDSTSPYSYTLSNVVAGSYKFYAKATDNTGLTNSTATALATVVAGPVNKAPVVNITTPVNNSTYSAPANITIDATATDPDGTITSVQFYNGTTLLTTDSISPYSCTITNLAAGNYSLVAKAVDNKGLTASSSTIAVSVITSTNKAPVVDITNPLTNAVYTAPATITLSAIAGDPDGTVTNVKFYNGSTLLKTISYPPYSFTMTNIAAGSYKFYAKVTDNSGLTNSSATVYVVVTAGSTKAIIPVTAAKAAKVNTSTTFVNSKTGVDATVDVKLAPNPAHTILNVYTTGLQQNKNASVSVMSASGILIKTIQADNPAQKIPVNISSLARGMYIIKIVSGNKIVYRQFVKM